MVLGLLDQVWTDGTWWLKGDGRKQFVYVEDGLITTHSFESSSWWRRREAEVTPPDVFHFGRNDIANPRGSLLAATRVVGQPP